MQWFIFFALLTLINCNRLEVKFAWEQMDYEFESPEMRKTYIESGNFVQRNVLPTGIATWKDKMFITIPRWRKGVPATLNYIPLTSGNESKVFNSIKIVFLPLKILSIKKIFLQTKRSNRQS